MAKITSVSCLSKDTDPRLGSWNCKRHNSRVKKLALAYKYTPGNKRSDGWLLINSLKTPGAGFRHLGIGNWVRLPQLAEG